MLVSVGLRTLIQLRSGMSITVLCVLRDVILSMYIFSRPYDTYSTYLDPMKQDELGLRWTWSRH